MRFLIAIIVTIPVFSLAQTGGTAGYQALDLVNNSRTAALSGNTISIADGDISQFFQNPAILDSISNGDIFFNINPYFADVFVFSGAYGFNIKGIENLSVGLTYIDYNDFRRTDASGNSNGTFNAQDYLIAFGKSHRLGPISFGVNLKILHSSIDSYGSTAILGDIGGIFRVKENWTIGMVIANLGGRITNFNELSTAKIPLDARIGTTFKPEYMPFRFTVTTTNLSERNVVEQSGSQGRSNEGIEKVVRRLSLGAELLLSDNFQLLFGYNHKRKQELKLSETSGGAGFSYGLMVNIKRFELRYSRAVFHAAGGSGFISLRTNLNDFKSIL
ncbi:MAG: type IX secretion system protein PorQ [Cyclobacteriaceae bacterium]